MLRSSRRAAPLAAALVSAQLATMRLGAQESAPGDSADGARVLPSVTVTATRSRRATTDAAAAVTVLAPRDYAYRSGVGVDAALSLVPGVLAQSRAGGSDVRLTVRGFGARGAGDRSNAGTSRGVRVLVDGIPETEPDGRTAFDNLDLALAQGIDVVRSNGSALWGNAAGGVVNVSTMPEEEGAFAAAQSVAGSFGLRRGVLRTGAPLGAGRAWGTLTRTTADGWRAHSDARRTLLGAGVVAPFGADRATTVGVYLTAADNFFRVPGPLSPAEAAADPRQANAVYASRDERRHNRLGRLGVTVDHRLGAPAAAGGARGERSLSALLFVNPKYLQRSERGTFRDFTRIHVGGSTMYRAGGPVRADVRHELSLGADAALQDGAVLFYSLSPENGRGTELRDDKAEGAANLGVFAQEELQLGERLVLTLGARHDAIRYDYRSHLDPTLDAVKTFSRTSPRVGALWRVGAGQSVYASVGGGIEAPAGNETDPAGTFGQDTVTAINPLLEPIRSTTYEVGTKRVATRLEGPVVGAAYDVALYLTDVRNEIVPYRGGRFYFTAGRARRAGLEVGGSAALRGGLSARLAGTLSRNRYLDYTVDSVHYGAPGRIADYSGNRVVGVPDWFWSAQLAWAPPAAARLGLEGRLGAQGTSRYWADDANRIAVPGYTTTSATLALGAAAGRRRLATLRAFVTVENLLDRRFIGSAFLNPDVVNGVPLVYEPGAPQAVIVGASVGL